MQAAIYNIVDGTIVKFINCPEDHIDLQYQEGQNYFINCPINATKIINNSPVIDPPLTKTIKQQMTDITVAIQNHLDLTAQSKNYDSMLSLVSYANSTNPTFKAEAEAGILWRDACWTYVNTQLALVDSGQRAIPTPSGSITELPTIVWPT